MEDEGGPVTAADEALDGVVASLARLIAVLDAGELDRLDDRTLLDFMQTFERVRNRMSVIDHHTTNQCESRALHLRMAQSTVSRLLASALRLSPGEATRRVRAAAACGDRRSPTGEALAPTRPTLAHAQRSGEVSAEHVSIVERALDGFDRPGFDPGDVETGERLLTNYALTFGPRDLKALAGRVTAAIDPDGTLPDDALNADRRHLTIRRTPDGAYVGDFRLTGSLGAKLTAVLRPLARPRLTTIETAEGHRVTEPDTRSLPQRTHDALEEICDRVLRSGTLPDSGGIPATVIVTIDLEDLQRRTGRGTTSDGTALSTADILTLAAQAEVIPAVLSRTGAVLDLGRTRRIASPTQTLALVARDGGCSFPGCAHPPEFCERHHIREWADGGETTMSNLTLLCRFHHHHFANRGWTCHINTDGLPTWTPPPWIDKQRRPLVNHRIVARRAAPHRQPELVGVRR